MAPRAHIRARYGAGVLFEISYGHTVTSMDDEFVRKADDAMTETVESVSPGSSLVDFFPILQYMPAWMPGAHFKRRALELRRAMDDAMNLPFTRVKEEMASGIAKPSFARRLLEEASLPISAKEERSIMAASAIMYQAGIDTTSAAITTFVLAMTIYPEVYRKAQSEMDAVVGRTRLPNLDDRPSLPYLECIVKETICWSCPLPLCIPHQVTEDDQYRGYHIPRGSMAIPNIWAMTQNPEEYPEPEVFNPDRFLKTAENPRDVLDPYTIVFGFGRRVCPGHLLADSSIWLVAANVIATMDIGWERNSAGDEIVPVPLFTSGTIRHPKPFLCTITPRHDKVAQLISDANSEDN